MALIECPECGREVSDRAAACPHCAYPIGKRPEMYTVEMAVDGATGLLFRRSCTVYGPFGERVAKCCQGDTVSFPCVAPMSVTVRMSGVFGRPTVTVEPGKKYQVFISGMGKVTVQEVGLSAGRKRPATGAAGKPTADACGMSGNDSKRDRPGG